MNILRPHITEKSMQDVGRGFYTFVIPKSMTKHEVRHAVHDLYHVDVVEVRTIVIHGKSRQSGKKRTKTQLPDRKKAMVRLVKGQTIEAFQIGEEPKK